MNVMSYLLNENNTFFSTKACFAYNARLDNSRLLFTEKF